MKPDPLYRQVYELLRDDISSGRRRPGEMLPNEFALADMFGVSQGTARKAIIELEREGIVERQQGRGTFVAETTESRARFHFFRLRDPDGQELEPELVEETVAPHPPDPKTGLNGDLIEILRLRNVGGRLGAFERILLPADRFPGIVERAPLPNTLYVLYERAFGIRIVQADETLRSVAANEAEAAALDILPGTPLLQVVRRGHDLSGNVAEYRESHYLTDINHYAVTLR